MQLAAKERKILDLPISALSGYGVGELRLQVDGMQLPDETLAPLTRSWTLGVRPAYPAQSRSYQAVINAAAKLAVAARSFSRLSARWSASTAECVESATAQYC